MTPRSAFFSALLLALAAALGEAGTPGYALGAQAVSAPSAPGVPLSVAFDELDNIYCLSLV